MPYCIEFAGGNSIFHSYDANGTKLSATHIIGNDTTVADSNYEGLWYDRDTDEV